MTDCPICACRFDDQDGFYAICSDCWDSLMAGADEGDDFDEMKRFLRWLSKSLDYSSDETIAKLLADSHAGTKLVEECLVLMDPKCMQNLLRKVMARTQ